MSILKIRDTITPSLEKLQRLMANRSPILLAMASEVQSIARQTNAHASLAKVKSAYLRNHPERAAVLESLRRRYPLGPPQSSAVADPFERAKITELTEDRATISIPKEAAVAVRKGSERIALAGEEAMRELLKHP